jgi:formylglycine-generating enzyme required for sulfatase activity
VLRALAKKPADRPASATELAHEFEKAVEALRASAPATNQLSKTQSTVLASDTLPNIAAVTGPTTPTTTDHAEVVEHRTAPFPLAIAAAGALVVLLVVGAILGLVGWQRGWFATTTPERHAPAGPQQVPPTTPVQPEKPPEGMVFVPAGDYTMGESEDAGSRDPRDPPNWPPHTVHVNAFEIDLHEVTNGEYERFVEATKSPRPSTWTNGPRPKRWSDLPVTGVTWVDADNYARWAGKRLSTEEEWEYAARGTASFEYPWGNAWDPSRTVTDGKLTDGPEPVGSHPSDASPFGALDMAGSVWEWTASNYTIYPGGPDVNPDMLEMKVIRGGSFTSNARAQRSTNRAVQPPYTRDPRVGFRCAKSVE